MALSENDCLGILRLMRALVREAGRADVDEAVSREFPSLEGDPRHVLVFYLKETIRAIEVDCGYRYGQTIALLRDNIMAEDYGRIRGIKVDLTPREQELYETEDVVVAEQPEMFEVVEGLWNILDEIMHDIEADQ